MEKDTSFKNSEIKDLFLQYVGVFAMVVLILLSVWSFKQQTEGYSRAQSQELLQAVALQTADMVEMKVQDSISYLTGATGYFSSFDDIRCYQSLQMLSKLSKIGGFYGMRVVTPDGKAYASPDNVVDLSQRDFFKKAMYGGIGISSDFIVYAPIYNDRRIVGFLCGLYDMSSLDTSAPTANFAGQVRSYVFQKNGNLIIRSAHATDFLTEGGNVWNTFQQLKFTDQTSFETFFTDVQNEESGSIEFLDHGEKQIAYYAPVGINGWYSIHMIPGVSITVNMKPIHDMVGILVIKIFACFLLLIVGIVYFSRKSQRALIHINRRMDFLTNAVPGGVQKCTPDEKGEFTYLSDGFVRMFGYSREQIKQRFHNSFYETIYEPDLAKVRRKLSRPKIGEVIELQYRVMTGYGEQLWLLNKLTLVKDEQGTYFYCVCLDITNLKTIQQELQMSNERFRISMANTSNVIFEYDILHDRISFVTKTRSLYALKEMILDAKDCLDWNGAVFLESQDELELALEEIRGGARMASCLIKMHRSDGKNAWNQVTLTNIFDDYGRPVRAIGMLEDVTENKEAELRFIKEKQYRSAMLADVQEVYEINLTKDCFLIEFGEKRKKKKLQLPKQFSRAIPVLVANLVAPKDMEQVLHVFSIPRLLCAYQNGEYTLEYQYRNLDSSGAAFWVSNRVNLLKDPQSGDIKAFSYVRDIDEQKQKELMLKYRSERDALTGLYNRAAAENLIIEFLKTEQLGQGWHGFLAIDLDNFKNVNDHLGHLAGDALLRNIAGTIQNVFRATDILARMGGDEFVVFMKGARSRQHIILKAQELVTKLQTILPNEIPEGTVSASIGIAFAPEHGSTFEQLYQKADLALYHVKRNGKNCCFLYDDSIANLPS